MEELSSDTQSLLKALPPEIFSLVLRAEKDLRTSMWDCLAPVTADELETFLAGNKRDKLILVNGILMRVASDKRSVLIQEDYIKDICTISIIHLMDGSPLALLLYPIASVTNSSIVSAPKLGYSSVTMYNFRNTFSQHDILTEYHVMMTREKSRRLVPDCPKKHLIERYNTEFVPEFKEGDGRRFVIAMFMASILEGEERFPVASLNIDIDDELTHDLVGEAFRECVLAIRDEVIRLTDARVSTKNDLMLDYD